LGLGSYYGQLHKINCVHIFVIVQRTCTNFQDILILNYSQREQTGGYDPPEVDAGTIPEKGREAVLLCISEFPAESVQAISKVFGRRCTDIKSARNPKPDTRNPEPLTLNVK